MSAGLLIAADIIAYSAREQQGTEPGKYKHLSVSLPTGEFDALAEHLDSEHWTYTRDLDPPHAIHIAGVEVRRAP